MRKGFVSAQYFFLCGAPRLNNFLVQVNAVYCLRRSPPFSLLLRNPATTQGKWSHYNPYFERLHKLLSRNWNSRPIERTLNLSEAGYRKRKVWVGKRPKRWCYTERIATTIFNAAQRCKAETMLQQFETISQQCCNAVLRQKSSLRIVPCNITLKYTCGLLHA